MIKKLLSAALAAALCLTAVTAYAAASDDDESDTLGFYEWGYITDTTNEYFFSTDGTVVVNNQEVETSPDYGYIYAGSDIYVPIGVYVEGGKDEELASDKLVKTDNVTISSKVIQGSKYVGDIELVDGKKLKLDGVEAGMYARIPVTSDYSANSRALITLRLVLSVRDVTYQDTQVSLKFRITNRKTEIYKNSVYGAKTPSMFKVRKNYSGEATFDFGNNIMYTAKVEPNAAYYMSLSRNRDENIASMYPDAFLDFYDFSSGKGTFASTGKLKIPVSRSNLAANDEGEESLYVYRVNGDTLTSLGNGVVSYDSKAQTLTINTKKPLYYVLSNQPLKKQLDGDEGDILKSGYAATSSTEMTEVGSDAESTASSASASAQEEDADGYVPEEDPVSSDWSNNINDNADTGNYINASNKSSDNPQTSDTAFPIPAAALTALSAAALVIALKKRGRKDAETQ